jgi:hypothetical protein
MLAEDITGSSYGMDEGIRRLVVDLATQTVDVNINHVSLGIILTIPHVLQDHGSAQDVLLVARQILE